MTKTKTVKVVTWVSDGAPIVTVYETSVSDSEILRLIKEEFGDLDVEITNEIVWTKAVV